MLFVDDEETLRLVAKAALRKPGYSIETACDGLEAWAKLESTEFDLLITDIDMPNLNGIELIRRVRASQLPVRIIVHSGGLTRSNLGELRELAIDATIEKVPTQGSLTATVARILEQVR